MKKVTKKVVENVNQFGDHACPHCGVMIINPFDCELKEGTASCVFCKKSYVITKKIAEIANENSRKYDKALDRVIKELQSA
jgi:predicted RNA-binding Zn-ribbon protein involved in translation (DUF1610 family)